MKTKFVTLVPGVKVKKETVFHKHVGDRVIIDAECEPNEYDHVVHIGSTKTHGDIFQAWTNRYLSDVRIYFGEKGEEDYEGEEIIQSAKEEKLIKDATTHTHRESRKSNI